MHTPTSSSCSAPERPTDAGESIAATCTIFDDVKRDSSDAADPERRSATAAVNDLVRAGVSRIGSPRVRFAACGASLWANQTGECAVDVEMLPDGVHPSSAGYARLLPCWAHALREVEREAPPGEPLSQTQPGRHGTSHGR